MPRRSSVLRARRSCHDRRAFLFLPLLSLIAAVVTPGHAAQLDPARWEPRVARYLEKDREQPPPRGAVLFAGSSSIDRWVTLKADFPGLAVINRGIGGTHLEDLPEYADRLVLPLHPKIYVVYSGENDLQARRSVVEVVAAFDRVRAQYFSAVPAGRLVYLAIKPSPLRRTLMGRMREANTLIAAACATDPRCTFVDVFTPMLDAAGEPRPELFSADNLHLSPEGYRLWTRLVGPAIGVR